MSDLLLVGSGGAGSGAAPPPSYTAKAVSFAADTILGMNGLVFPDASKLTLALWVRPTSLSDANIAMIGDQTNIVNPTALQLINDWNVNTDVALDLYDATNTDEFTVVANANTLAVDTWVGLFFSVDTAHGAGSKKGFVYANGVNALNALNDSSPSFNVAVNGYNFGVPIPLNGGYTQQAIEYADVQFWIGTFIDPSINGNISKFVDGSGKPVDPATAALAFGQQTFLFSGDATAFATNQGSAGACSVSGTALTNAATSPSD